jgi:hypothetical protein
MTTFRKFKSNKAEILINTSNIEYVYTDPQTGFTWIQFINNGSRVKVDDDYTLTIHRIMFNT